MKLKYYLRGLGLGIILSTIVLSISFNYIQNNQLEKDNENAKQDAKQVASNTEGDVDLEDLLTPTTEQKDNATESTAADSNKNENNSTKDENNLEQNNIDQNKTEETKATDSNTSKTESTEAESTEAAKTDVKPVEATQASNKANTESEAAKTEEAEEIAETVEKVTPKVEDTNVVIQITKGMTSEDVARVLKNNNIIKNSFEFNQYLKANGYSTTIAVGSYKISKNASYQQIADKITSR